MAKQIVTGENSRQTILRGVNFLADAVKITLVKRALEEPMRQNAYNAGQEGAVVVGRVPDSEGDDIGFNAWTGEYMIKAVVPMLWTISIIFLSLWCLGVTIPYTMHGYIHLLLVLPVASVMIPFFHKRSAVG